jgi:hypothetical protein
MAPTALRFEIVDDQMAVVLRAKSPAEKVEMISAASRTARLLMAAGIRYRHPTWSGEEVQAAVTRRLSGGAE